MGIGLSGNGVQTNYELSNYEFTFCHSFASLEDRSERSEESRSAQRQEILR